MKTIEIVIDFGSMLEFENCENFIWFVKKAIKAKREFKGINFFDFFGERIIFTGRSDTKTIFNMATLASYLTDIVYEYNQARKEHGKKLFIVDICAIVKNHGYILEQKYLCLSNDIQWRN